MPLPSSSGPQDGPLNPAANIRCAGEDGQTGRRCSWDSLIMPPHDKPSSPKLDEKSKDWSRAAGLRHDVKRACHKKGSLLGYPPNAGSHSIRPASCRNHSTKRRHLMKTVGFIFIAMTILFAGSTVAIYKLYHD